MKISWVDAYETRITAVYWSHGMNMEKLRELGKDCDYIQVWYPCNLADDIYEKYSKLITYIEAEAKWKGEAYSLQIDLAQSVEKIIGRFSKTRKYEVRRAKERDNLTVEFLCNFDETELRAFENYYNCFARQTNELANLETEKVRALNEAGLFVLAKIKDAEGNILTVHGYVVDRVAGIAALFSSSSHFRENKDQRALIGRANGLLHYESMIYFKNSGFRIYDFGGIYLGNEKQHYMSVAAFKQSFGGECITFQNGFLIPIYEAEMIDYNLTKLYQKIEHLDVVLWGYSSFGKYIEEQLQTRFSKQCKYIIDNQLCEKKEKCTSEKILGELEADDIFILIGTSFHNYQIIINQDNMKRFKEVGRVAFLRG